MSKTIRTVSGKTSAKASASRRATVSWPTVTAGRVLRHPTGKVSEKSMGSIMSTSKTLNRALKRLADK